MKLRKQKNHLKVVKKWGRKSEIYFGIATPELLDLLSFEIYGENWGSAKELHAEALRRTR